MDVNNSSPALQAILRREVKVPVLKPEETVTKADEKEYEAFSFGRVGIRPQLMLALRRSNGKIRVRPYAILQAIDTDDEHSDFTLDFPGLRVRVQGRNLGKLFRYLWLHRVAEIIEVDRSSNFLAEANECVVESLDLFEGRLSPVVVRKSTE